MHIPFIAFTAGISSTGFGAFPTHDGLVALPLALAGGALQLRHSLAAARGERPRYWRATYAGLLVLTYAPWPAFATQWASMTWLVIASSLMLLPRRPAAPTAAAAAVGWAAWSVSYVAAIRPLNPAQASWEFLYPLSVALMGGGCLYGAARLTRLMAELQNTRAELADLAVARERLRISRDLHDLLGHTLSAIALKGDVAVRLLRRENSDDAAAEIDSLTSLARTALHDLQDVTRDERVVSLAAEIRGAASLLEAAGIPSRVDVPAMTLPEAVDALMGWAIREGVTNVLRHSSASTCSITVQRDGGRVRLTIENDHADEPSGEGVGLRGLTARSEDLSGTATGSRSADGWFHLIVDVPEVAA